MVAPGVWREEGPGCATGPSTMTRAHGALPIGRMEPPAVSPSHVSKGGLQPKLGIRRKP